MNFQKIISVGVVAGMLVAVAPGVTAKEYIDTKNADNKLMISISNIEKKNVIGVIVKDGTDPAVNSNIYGICETDGETLSFIMPVFKTDVDNEYTLYVSGEEAGNFFYAKEQSILSAKAALFGMTDSSFDAALTRGSEQYFALGAMGFNLDGYTALAANSGEARTMFSAIFSDTMTEDETAAIFNKAVASVSINHGGLVADEMLKVNPTFGEKAYSETDAGLKAWVNEYITANTPISGVNDFEEKYELANILYLLDNAKFSDINTLLTTYETQLELAANADYAEYKTLTTAGQTVVHDTLVKTFNETACKSTAIFKNALTNAVSAARTGGNSGGNSGGGGGGGSSSSSGNNRTDSFMIQPTAPLATEAFNDLGNVVWAKEAIKALAEKKIVSGDGTGSFKPMDFVTREQYVKMIVSATQTSITEASGEFDDVDNNAWYAPYVIGAYKAGIVFGISDTSFGIGSNISRQDMAVIAYRALGGKTLEKKRDFAEFTDSSNISSYAQEAIKALYEAEIISGKDGNLFDPLGTATRAESAVVIYNMFVR